MHNCQLLSILKKETIHAYECIRQKQKKIKPKCLNALPSRVHFHISQKQYRKLQNL